MVVSYPARTWSEGQTSLRRTALLMNAPGAGFKTVTTSPQYNKSSTMELEETGRSQENGRIHPRSPPKELGWQCGDRSFHCLYLLGMVVIIVLMLQDSSREKNYDYDKMYDNSKKVHAAFLQILSMDRKIQSLRQDTRHVRHDSPEHNDRRLSAQQQLSLQGQQTQNQQQALDPASARQDFLEDFTLAAASIGAEKQTHPRPASISQQSSRQTSSEETDRRKQEPPILEKDN